MRSFSLLAMSLVSAAAIATAAQGTTYTDSTFDLFDNGLDNLDISGVEISDDGTNLSIAITTRGFQSWTKYMTFIDSAAGGTTSNAWSRPLSPRCLSWAELFFSDLRSNACFTRRNMGSSISSRTVSHPDLWLLKDSALTEHGRAFPDRTR